jgi:hypothetical protein
MIYLIGIMLIAIVVRNFKKVKVKEEVKKEPSFYERMQMWKYANEVIEHCFKIESE